MQDKTRENRGNFDYNHSYQNKKPFEKILTIQNLMYLFNQFLRMEMITLKYFQKSVYLEQLKNKIYY